MRELSARELFQAQFKSFVGGKPFIDRKELATVSGYTVGSLANMDCRNEIPGRIKLEKKNLYAASAILDWLVSRIAN